MDAEQHTIVCIFIVNYPVPFKSQALRQIMTVAEHEFQEAAYSTALIRSLQHGGVKFLRYLTVDVCNNLRCKAIPIDYLLRNDGIIASLNCLVSVATVCYAGLPFYADSIVQDSGMDARNQITIKPDLFTLRVLPYAPKTAMVLGTLHDQYSNELSPVCTRGLLKKIVKDAAEKQNIAFVRKEAGIVIFRECHSADTLCRSLFCLF